MTARDDQDMGGRGWRDIADGQQIVILVHNVSAGLATADLAESTVIHAPSPFQV
jgi:hypothetical protein